MKTLILFAHADPGVRGAYLDALRSVGIATADVDLLFVNRAGLSSAYRQLVAELRARGSGTLLERVCAHAGALHPSSYRRVILATFSAGYALAREVLEESASADQVDAYVALDSVHDGPTLARLDWLTRYATRALAVDAVLWLAHTDVPTPQPPSAGAFASTTQVARELCQRVGVEPPSKNGHTENAGLRVASYDVRPPAQAKSEHSQALVGWGPAFLASAVRRAVELTSQRETSPDLGPDPRWTLGERTMFWVGGELAADPRELPGAKHDMRILSYSRHCRRGGTFGGVSAPGVPLWAGGTPLPLPRDEDAWCAAAASASLLGALLPGEKPPHGLRVSVRELVEDARAAGTLRGADYEPQPGDLAIYARAGGDPMKGGTGHVRMVVGVQPGAKEYLGVGGNEGNKWTWAMHPMRPPSWRAWVARS